MPISVLLSTSVTLSVLILVHFGKEITAVKQKTTEQGKNVAIEKVTMLYTVFTAKCSN